MKARIVDIENEDITVKTENGKFITLPKKKLKFNCHLNQNVVIEKNEDKIYILPDAQSFWGDEIPHAKNKTKPKKRNRISKKQKILICVLVFLILIFSPFAIIKFVNNLKLEQANILETCLNDAGGTYSKEHITNKIECYKKYGGSDAEDKIAENEQRLKQQEADECAQKAEENYAISDEEQETANSTNDPSYIIMLNTRTKNKAKSIKVCYQNIEDYDTSYLDATIKDIELKNAALENIIKTQNSRQNSHFHCSTRFIGSSGYTNCY